MMALLLLPAAVQHGDTDRAPLGSSFCCGGCEVGTLLSAHVGPVPDSANPVTMGREIQNTSRTQSSALFRASRAQSPGQQGLLVLKHVCGLLQGLTYSEVSGHFFAAEEVYDSGTVAGLMGRLLCHSVCQPAACTHTHTPHTLLTLSVMLRCGVLRCALPYGQPQQRSMACTLMCT